MAQYVKSRSWHVPSGLMSRGGLVHTLCGRWMKRDAPSAMELPMREKSCETCLRGREVRDRVD